MKMIYKYQLNVHASQELILNEGSKPLHVANQDGQLCLWMEVELDSDVSTPYLINIVGTGQRLTEQFGVYVGTAHIDGFVWHVYVN